MNRSSLLAAALLLFTAAACKKSADATSQISLTPSTAVATVGQTVSVTLSSNSNASRWTVTPSTATKTYTITNSKVNYFTFQQPGTYTVGVSSKAIALDSTSTKSLDSCWAHNAHTCIKGIDSASVEITVVK
jgi:YbbR domain-containing protein